MASRLSILAVVLLVAAPEGAQSTASLQGRVFDASGSAIHGATISVSNDSMGFARSVATDEQGRYHVEGIPSNTYDVRAAANGFKLSVVAITFDVGRTL